MSVTTDKNPVKTKESPEYVRLSLAGAMQLGYNPARFYRGARMTCINLLLTYASGCAANCSYCGLARERDVAGERSFIRVPWPTEAIDDIIKRISKSKVVQRVCISMITHRRGIEDTIYLTEKIRKAVDVPVSILVAPTVVNKEDLVRMKQAGADKMGVAFDLPNEELFDKHRGKNVKGPHKWEKYWEVFNDAVEVFGQSVVGSHFMVGMGETEEEMVNAFQKVVDLGGINHLFSFFPEEGSTLAGMQPPPLDVYRRIQIACELIDSKKSRADKFSFNEDGKINEFGVSQAELDEVIDSGRPFRTRGCLGNNGEVACNRPFANSLPGNGIRNFPFPPDKDDIRNIREQLNENNS